MDLPSISVYSVPSLWPRDGPDRPPLIIGSAEAANDLVSKTSVGVDMKWEIVELGISDGSCGNVVSEGEILPGA